MGDSANRPETATSTVFLLAELPYHELLRKRDPKKAMKLEARMQQILGEAVYLFDGRVIDSIGPRMIAIMPDSARALNAARKSQLDLSEHNRAQPPSGDVVEAALVVHSGDAVSDGSALTSPTVSTGLQLLRSMQPGQVLVSERALREAGARIPPAAAGEFGGIRFYEPPPEEKKPEPVVVAAPAPVPPRRRNLLWLIPVAAIALLLLGFAAFLLTRERGAAPAVATTTAPTMPPPTAPTKKRVSLEPFAMASASPAAARLEAAVADLLRLNTKLELSSDADSISLRVSSAPDNPAMIVPAAGSNTGPPVRLDPVGGAAVHVLGFFADALAIPRGELTSSNPAVMGKFVEAVSASRSSDRGARGRAPSLLQSVSDTDPTFVGALRFGIEMFDSMGDRARAIRAAERLLAVDPNDLTVRKQLVVWQFSEGRSSESIPHLAALLGANASDPDALLAAGRISLSAGDDAAFQRVVRRLETVEGSNAPLHQPDLLAVTGQIDPAVKAYYAIERSEPNNASLALKIGRIAVLRHSLPIAEIELEKLRRLDPDYGYPLLQAYIQAEKRAAGEAEKYLQQARAAATWKSDPFTASAEVYAILSEHGRVLEALRNAEEREPTLTYILSNPLFRYLETDSDYLALKARLEQKRNELRPRLSEIPL